MPKSISRMRYFDVFFIFPGDFEVSHMFSQFFWHRQQHRPFPSLLIDHVRHVPSPSCRRQWRYCRSPHLAKAVPWASHRTPRGPAPISRVARSSGAKTVSVVSSDPMKTGFCFFLGKIGYDGLLPANPMKTCDLQKWIPFFLESLQRQYSMSYGREALHLGDAQR